MTLAVVRAGGAVCGLAVLAVAGSVLGGGWWLVAVLAAVGAVCGRAGSLVQAVATLVLAGGAAAEDSTWLVPLLVLGVVASVETSDLSSRTSRVRPRARIGPPVTAPAVAAAAAAAVLHLSRFAPPFAVRTTLAGVLAALALLAALRA